MKYNCKPILLFVFVLVTMFGNAQGLTKPDYPEIGRICPDFDIINIEYFKKKSANVKEFRGKWLILDFWNRYCSACISSFPKMDRLQKRFNQELQVLFVGYNGSEYSSGQIHEVDDKAIRSLYERIRVNSGLNLPVAYDSSLFKRLDIVACPHLIVIDDKGIVRGITNSINENDVAAFLDGKTPILEKAYWTWHEPRLDKVSFNPSEPFLINGNGGIDTGFLFRSILSPWDPTLPMARQNFIEDNLKNRSFQVLGVSLTWLYNYAYFGKCLWSIEDTMYGKFWRSPILEIKDSSLFRVDFRTGGNIFCYSLMVPRSKAVPGYLQQVMQRDLQNYFGYNVEIETRKMPYWKLIVDDQRKKELITKGAPPSYKGIEHAGFTAKNFPIKNLLAQIGANNPSGTFIDETGIDENIDISLDCLMNNLNEVKAALKKSGLDIVEGYKEMKVIVIKDNHTLNDYGQR